MVKEAIDPSASVPPSPAIETLLLGAIWMLALLATGRWLAGVGVGGVGGVGVGGVGGVGVGGGRRSRGRGDAGDNCCAGIAAVIVAGIRVISG